MWNSFKVNFIPILPYKLCYYYSIFLRCLIIVKNIKFKVRAVCRAMLDATRLLYSTPPRVVPSTLESNDLDTDNKLSKDAVSISVSFLFSASHLTKE